MTLNDITIKVRRSLSDDTYDATLIMDAANYFIYSLFANTRTRLMETSDTLSGSAGDTTIDFPSDMMLWLNLYVTSPTTYDIGKEYQPYGDFVKDHPDFATATSQAAHAWTDFGNAMRFSYPLLTDTTIAIDYIRQPQPMIALGSKCEVPDQYIEMVVKGTKIRLQEIDENYDYAGVELSDLDPLTTAFIRNEARGASSVGPIVIRTGRRRARL